MLGSWVEVMWESHSFVGAMESTPSETVLRELVRDLWEGEGRIIRSCSSKHRLEVGEKVGEKWSHSSKSCMDKYMHGHNIFIYLYAYLSIKMCVYKTDIYTCICICILYGHICVYVNIYLHICICMYIYVFIYVSESDHALTTYFDPCICRDCVDAWAKGTDLWDGFS